jgi:putative peptidoglycan lipid II flippase
MIQKLSNIPTSDPSATAAAHQRRIFLQSTAIVATSVFLSRVLGFFREWAIAHQVGSNAVTDAYYAAFTIPDVLNYLLAGGSLSITLLPVFLEYSTSRREEEAWRVFSIVLSVMSALLLVLLIVAEIFAPQLTYWIAPGFKPEQHLLVTHLTRIMLPAQAFFFIGGVLSAVQYAEGRFLIPSLAPLIYNGMIIGFGLLLSRMWGIAAFSWGVLAGSFLGNFLIQAYGVGHISSRFHFLFDFSHPGFRRFLRLSVPIMLGFSLIFVDDWAVRWFGSFLIPASITWLGYGKTLMRVVVAIFAQAAGVASFPLMARSVAEKKWEEMKEGLQHALRHVILAMVPVSVLMAVLSRQIVYLLFSHTRLSPHDMEQTSLAMTVFLVGAIAWGVQAIIGRGFYALGDTLTPTLIGTGMALAWLPVYWQLGLRFQHLGLAAASSLGVIAYTAVLCVVLYRRLRMSLAALGSALLKALAAAAGAGLIAVYLQRKLEAVIAWQSMKGSLTHGVLISGAFLVVFLALGALAGLAPWHELRAAFPGKGER